MIVRTRWKNQNHCGVVVIALRLPKRTAHKKADGSGLPPEDINLTTEAVSQRCGANPERFPSGDLMLSLRAAFSPIDSHQGEVFPMFYVKP